MIEVCLVVSMAGTMLSYDRFPLWVIPLDAQRVRLDFGRRGRWVHEVTRISAVLVECGERGGGTREETRREEEGFITIFKYLR